jgi:hypothetical protein
MKIGSTALTSIKKGSTNIDKVIKDGIVYWDATPYGLTSVVVSATQIDLSWTYSSSNENGFKIERSTDGIDYTEIYTTAVSEKTYSDTGLTIVGSYYYRVRAIKGITYSNYSNITISCAPMTVQLISTGTGVGVSTLAVKSVGNVPMTLSGSGLFYDDIGGTINPTTSRTIPSGSTITTFYIKVTTGTRNLTFYHNNDLIGIGQYGTTGWNGTTNCSRFTSTLLNLARSLKETIIYGNSSLTGTWGDLPSALEVLYFGAYVTAGGISGTALQLPRNIYYLRIENQYFSGNVIDLPRNLTYISLSGNTYISLTGDIKDLPQNSYSILSLRGGCTVYGDLADIPIFTYMNIYEYNRITNYTTGKIWTPLNYFYFRPDTGYGLSTEEIDNLIIDLAKITWTATPSAKTLYLGGSNAFRSATSNDAVVSLQAQGVTVTVNGII